LETKSLATYFPLWVEIVENSKARFLVRNLKHFEHEFGLSTTDQTYNMKNKQWSYPNGWAPLHFIVINGLRKYDFNEDANRITKKWLKLCASRYERNKHWEEKYLVVSPKDIILIGIRREDDLRYKHQTELYWSQAVFIFLYKQLKYFLKD